jgi:crossover junction endodeoxyribonuclease RuvC
MVETMNADLCILGVDPGLKGAIAFYFPVCGRIAAEDMPVVAGDVDASTLAAKIRVMAPTHAIVEAVHSMPGQGVSSSFKFGKGFGQVLGVITTLGVPLHLVGPAKWKRALWLSAEKDKSRALALQYWPNRSDLFGRVKDDGRAEAALLAYYCVEHILRK